MKNDLKYEQVDLQKLFKEQGLDAKGIDAACFKQVSLNFGGFVVYTNVKNNDIDLDDLIVDYTFGDSAITDVGAEPLLSYLSAKFATTKAAKAHILNLFKQKPN
jgi:hypothetical protein